MNGHFDSRRVEVLDRHVNTGEDPVDLEGMTNTAIAKTRTTV